MINRQGQVREQGDPGMDQEAEEDQVITEREGEQADIRLILYTYTVL